LRRWRDSDTAAAPRWVAVNVAADQFVAPDFVDAVHAAVHDNGLRARDLALEITEGVLLLDVPQLQVTINNLKAMGVSLVVDDFGTGFAGLEYFRRYGIDGLKIDRSFVAALLETQEQAAIVTAALRFADALGLTVTAEGIETVEQADWLRAAGCRFGQGYLYARPLPFDGVTKFFAAA
jgi:EAL domain-containing protein (putative c-di-GMP-specific phosphodiesterase class I)